MSELSPPSSGAHHPAGPVPGEHSLSSQQAARPCLTQSPFVRPPLPRASYLPKQVVICQSHRPPSSCQPGVNKPFCREGGGCLVRSRTHQAPPRAAALRPSSHWAPREISTPCPQCPQALESTSEPRLSSPLQCALSLQCPPAALCDRCHSPTPPTPPCQKHLPQTSAGLFLLLQASKGREGKGSTSPLQSALCHCLVVLTTLRGLSGTELPHGPSPP